MLIGVVGGGQLGRMLALAGIPLGMRFRFFDVTPDAPARHVGELVVGDFSDPAAGDRFAFGHDDPLDAITFEFENVPVSVAHRLAAARPTFPPPRALAVGQDRAQEKALFSRIGLEVPAYRVVFTHAEFADAVASLGPPLVAKTCRMGYDGKGQAVIRAEADTGRAWHVLQGAAPLGIIVERMVPFDAEVSVIACRARDGATACYPLIENVHRQGILRVSRVPSRWSVLQAAAEHAASRILDELDYVGVLTIEFFVVQGRLLANEMAPRVHNSGHWTIEGAATSQFANHVRAVAGLPLGPCHALGPCAMVNIIGRSPPLAALLSVPGASVHLYDKAPRPGRKLGHVTLRAHSPTELDATLAHAAALCDEATE
ncbi:MAG: 5-(carboxyamino)imidazole ribonucleotide synthase [Planctomycetota bacterium]|nr:5-(carboxyamino)imidazole ribonucleotide synthase [Planctomycetota bacterium]